MGSACVAEFFNFNSHAHVERDEGMHPGLEEGRKDFNSHAHVERDFFKQALQIFVADFNSHAHVERD